MKYLFALVISAVSLTAHAQNLILTIANSSFAEGDSVALQKNLPKRMSVPPVFSAIVKGGKCVFNLNERFVERYTVTFKKQSVTLFLTPQTNEVKIDGKQITLAKPDEAQKDNEQFDAIIRADSNYNGYLIKRFNYLTLLRNGQQADAEKIKVKLDSLLNVSRKSQENDVITWVAKHPKSAINSYELYIFCMGNHNISGKLPDDEIRAVFNKFSDAAKDNSWGKEVIYRMFNLAEGSKAPEFTGLSPTGKTIKLSDYKGKLVLLDFWASWCIPCRNENPNVAAVYDAYKDKSFTVLSVSLDSEKKDWIKAIKKDGMPWGHASELNGRKNKVAAQYYVSAIPANFLIDPAGNIVAKNLYGEELKKAVANYIK